MADDIVKRLQDVVCWCNEFDGVCDACQAADEIERLRRWKAEATAVLNRWDSLCGRTLEVVRIGDRKSDAMATYIESQKAEIERLRAAGDALVESLDHSRADIRSAVAAWEEARRG